MHTGGESFQNSDTYMHHPASIHEFLKPYEKLFLEFESFVEGQLWLWKTFSHLYVSPGTICETLEPYE